MDTSQRRNEVSKSVSNVRRDLKEVLKSTFGEWITLIAMKLPMRPKRDITKRNSPSTKYLNSDIIISFTQCRRS